MAESDFARKQLLKHGWTEGGGLGKEESGIKQAIKVKIKKDTTGVGHDPGKEFTYHWWDHVFNKAANNIDVKTTEKGVTVYKKSQEEIKTFPNKSLLYSGFVKAAVLQPSENNLLDEVSCHENSEEEQSEEENKAISKLTEEELFSQCEGRTAHKGARHGLKQNAKLLRIQEQEKKILEELRKNTSKIDIEKVKQIRPDLNSKQPDKDSHSLSGFCKEGNISIESGVIQNSGRKKSKKSKKRGVEREVKPFEEETLTLPENNNQIDSDNIPKKKRKKSKKDRKEKD